MTAGPEEGTAPPEELERRLAAMPKAVVRAHREGATDPETVWRMADRNGVRLPAVSLA